MNPRLVKFAVELQNGEKKEKKQEYISFSGGKKSVLDIYKSAYVTVPVDKN